MAIQTSPPIELMVFIRPQWEPLQMPRPYPATSSSWGLTGVKFKLGEGEKERERGDWDYGKMREWAPGEEECKVWEVFISLQVDWHAPTRGNSASADCPRADYHQLCGGSEHAWTNGPPMPHLIKSLPETYVNGITERGEITSSSLIGLTWGVMSTLGPRTFELEDIVRLLL